MIDTYANHVSLDVWSVSQLNAIMKCGHLDSQEILTCEMQLRTFGTATFLVMEQANVLPPLFPLGGC
jgi:hypothetical protein